MISGEAVEAAARVNYEARAGTKWAMLNNYAQAREQSWMRIALEAAAPHMLDEAKADAWDEGVNAVRDYNGYLAQRNPYRSRT